MVQPFYRQRDRDGHRHGVRDKQGEKERERREEREKGLLERIGLYNYRIWQGQMIKKDKE